MAAEGQVMMDNITVGIDGHVIIQEDPGGQRPVSPGCGITAPVTDTLTQLAEHDPFRFSGSTPPFTQNEESSGVLDVTSLFNLARQVRVPARHPGALCVRKLRDRRGGQLQLMVVDRTINGTSGNDTFNGTG
jgi:hypothetical protein